MKLAINAALATVLVAASSMALAKAPVYHVPFQHVEVKAGESIKGSYDFNSNSEVMVCSVDQGSDALSSIAWTYKTVARQIGLPARLKDSDKTQGAWADPSGELVITNHFGSTEPNGSMFVTCNYQSIA